MTREEILNYFKDINFMYNNSSMFDTLKRMLDELTEPCEDAVSREAVNKAINDIRGWINSDNRGSADYFIVDKIEEIINGLDLPSVQPEREKGEWMPHTIGFRKCSCCNSIWSSDITNNIFTNYCPNCGADMRGGE